MRHPKWTEEQTNTHARWRVKELNLRGETPEQRDEFYFCLDYYLNTADGGRRKAELIKRCDEIDDMRFQQASDVALSVLNAGEEMMIRMIRDDSQDRLVKELIVQSLMYSRDALKVILFESDSIFCWLVIGHPDITVADLGQLIRRFGDDPFLRAEATVRLTTMMDQQRISA